MGKKLVPTIIICLLTLLTGCWDRIEIEQRGFVIGAAVDFPVKPNIEESAEAKNKPKGKYRYVYTTQIVVPGALGPQSGGGGGGDSKAFMNVSTEGDTLFETTRQLATRVSRTPFYPHMKVLIISEDVARSGEFPNVVDLFLRDHEMRRGTKVMIAKDEARKVLNVKAPNEKLPAMYIQSIAENREKTARMAPPLRIGDLHEKLLIKQSFTVPRIVASEIEAKIAGVAVFHGHNNKMVAWLGEEETEGLAFLRGDVKGGILKANVEDNLVVYEIKGAEQGLKADISNKDNIQFTYTIEAEGNIVESLESVDYLNNPSIWNHIQKKLEEEIERMANDTIEKLHQDLQVDVMGLGAYLSQEHPKIWKSVKDEWDHGENFFAKSTIKVNAKVIVRNSGVINQSEPKQE